MLSMSVENFGSFRRRNNGRSKYCPHHNLESFFEEKGTAQGETKHEVSNSKVSDKAMS